MKKRPMGHIPHLRKQFKSINTYDYIIRKKILLTLKIYWFFIWRNLYPLHPTEGCFVPRLVKIGSNFLEKRIFLTSSMYFRYFKLISPWKRVGSFIWRNLNPLHPGILCAKKVIDQTGKHVENPIKLTLRSKINIVGIMNVCDTSSHSDTPMCKYGKPMSNLNKRPMDHIAHLRKQFKSIKHIWL